MSKRFWYEVVLTVLLVIGLGLGIMEDSLLRVAVFGILLGAMATTTFIKGVDEYYEQRS